jgi:hypothetical protein
MFVKLLEYVRKLHNYVRQVTRICSKVTQLCSPGAYMFVKLPNNVRQGKQFCSLT